MSILTVKDLCKVYGEQSVLSDVNFSVEKGEIVAIIGASDSGKNDLLRALNHIEPPTRGEVYFGDQLITKKNVDAVRRKIPMLRPDTVILAHLSVSENIMLPLQKILKIPKNIATEKVKETLQTVGMSEYADSYPDTLTSGQRQRVALSRCLALSPEVILLEEPTGFPDSIATTEMLSVLKKIASSEVTIIFTTDHLSLVRDIATRVLYIDSGTIYEQGSATDILDNPNKPNTKAFIHQKRIWECTITQRDFDYAHMLSSLNHFCYTHAIAGTISDKVQVITNELVLKLILPENGYCSVKLEYSDRLETYELSVRYAGKKNNIFADSVDNASTTLVKSKAKVVHFEYIDGFNIIRVKI